MPSSGRDAIQIESPGRRLLIATAAVVAIGVDASLGREFAARVVVHVAGLSAPFFLDFGTADEAEERANGIAAACGFAPTAAREVG